MANVLRRSIDRATSDDKQPHAAARRTQAHAIRPSPDLFQWAGVVAPSRVSVAPFSPQKLVKIARGIWHVSMPAKHSVLAERYFASCGLTLPADIADCIRFHASLRNGDTRAPGLVLLLRDLFDDAPCGIVRVYLNDAGNVVGRRALGRVYDSAVKLDADENSTAGLTVCVGIKQAVTARAQGHRPMFALAGTNAIADFPLIPAVEALTVIAGPDDGPAVAEVTSRWRNAGREVRIVSTNNKPPPRDIEPHGGDP